MMHRLKNHVYIFQRKIIKVCKRHFACNGTVVEHSEYGEVIQFQGFYNYRIVLRTPWLAIFEFEIYGSWSIQR